ncbi:MAG: T9SS type A sorting domain-containing protein [Bacteroidetes bacterium]|nr:T9SS type A sorting domain-containing protein [Bacteroidota bacterium]
MDGKFGDGLQMTSGGIGYNTSSIDYTNYMFGGDVNDDAGWTEITESNPPADRRGVGSIYLGKLEPDNSVCASFGFIFSDAGTSVSNTASVDLLKTYAAELKALYQAIDSQDCLERLYIPLPPDSIVSNAGFLVYPNPTTDLLNIATSFEQNTSFTITIYNAIGGLVYSTELTNSEHSQIHTVSLNQHATGIYFIQIAYAGITTIYPVLFK